MSQWRREAVTQLPELQHIVCAPLVDNPMMLWIELNTTFATLCEGDPLPLDLLRRIWGYGLWCLAHPNGEVSTAAALGFFEHAIDSPARIAALPSLTTRSVLDGLRDLLCYHHSPETVSRVLDHAFPARSVQRGQRKRGTA